MAKKRSLVIEILGNNKMGRAVRDAMGSLKRLGSFARWVGRGIGRAFKWGAAGVAALTTGIGMAVKEAMEFNVQMARAASMSGGASVFREMREEAMQLSAELGIARAELSRGFYEAGSRGIGREDQFAFVRQAAKLAVIDGGEVADMVIGVTNLMNAYNMTASEATRITDMMMASVKGGGMSFSELAENISKASPVAASANVEMKEMLAAVAQMTAKGTPANEALTSIRNAMLALNKELGEGWGNTYTLQAGLEEVAKQAGYSSNALELIFGKRDVAKVFQMVGANAAGAAAKLDEIAQSAGTVQQSFDDIQKHRALDRIMSTLGVIATRFGIAVDEGADLSGLLDTLASNADKFGKEYAAKILPYVQEIRAAVDQMLSPDTAQVAAGKAAIASMFDKAGDVIKPKFEEWGEAAGAAIWRGFKRGGKKIGGAAAQNITASMEGATGRNLQRFMPSGLRGAVSSVAAFAGTEGSFSEKFRAGNNAAIRSAFGLPGSSPSTALHVKEVRPIDGVGSL